MHQSVKLEFITSQIICHSDRTVVTHSLRATVINRVLNFASARHPDIIKRGRIVYRKHVGDISWYYRPRLMSYMSFLQ